eukprot:m.66580 g.66580  ORF g.66580 m.66580 type:complete len:411 (+) comp9823_c0_seq2:119-1351(+)
MNQRDSSELNRATTDRMRGATAVAAVVVAVAGQVAAAAKAPSFIIMLADDMGWGDWSLTGSPARTPHLEAMSRADTGVWFQRAYSGNPICSPTRASLQTGRTPARSCIYGVEQHILCVEGRGGCSRGEYALGNATRDADANYLSGFYGKWHLGSLSNRGVGSPDCYPKLNDTHCQLGYWEVDDTPNGPGCCFGVDSHLDVAHPLNFGYDEFVATPECAASATTNCGCFFNPSPHNDTPCELGHYHQSPGMAPYNECMQYYAGNLSGPPRTTKSGAPAPPTPGGGTAIEPLTYVSGVDDEKFLVDQVEGLVRRAVAADRPFLAVVCFHGVRPSVLSRRFVLSFHFGPGSFSLWRSDVRSAHRGVSRGSCWLASNCRCWFDARRRVETAGCVSHNGVPLTASFLRVDSGVGN